jgi:hypothetical protein
MGLHQIIPVLLQLYTFAEFCAFKTICFIDPLKIYVNFHGYNSVQSLI